jgi:hypothetical protein
MHRHERLEQDTEIECPFIDRWWFTPQARQPVVRGVRTEYSTVNTTP